MCVCVCAHVCMFSVTGATPHLKMQFFLIKFYGLVYGIHGHVRGSPPNATIKLLCAAVRGIIQRKDLFVVKLKVNDEQVSRLMEFEEIAKSKCAVTERKEDRATVLELVPHRECELCMMHYM